MKKRNDISEHIRITLCNNELKILVDEYSSEIRKILGPKHRDVVAIPEDIVFLDY